MHNAVHWADSGPLAVEQITQSSVGTDLPTPTPFPNRQLRHSFHRHSPLLL